MQFLVNFKAYIELVFVKTIDHSANK